MDPEDRRQGSAELSSATAEMTKVEGTDCETGGRNAKGRAEIPDFNQGRGRRGRADRAVGDPDAIGLMC